MAIWTSKTMAEGGEAHPKQIQESVTSWWLGGHGGSGTEAMFQASGSGSWQTEAPTELSRLKIQMTALE